MEWTIDVADQKRTKKTNKNKKTKTKTKKQTNKQTNKQKQTKKTKPNLEIYNNGKISTQSINVIINKVLGVFFKIGF